ncbi:MAG TPA: SDR family oxidoreductase [Sandaracinaceae bacterium]
MTARWIGDLKLSVETTEGDMTLTDRTALITGASRGLGRALALELARRGATVVAVARDRPALEDVVGTIRAAGGRAHAIDADVGAPDAAARIAGAAAAMAGPIDVLVHNASTLGPVPLVPLSDTREEDFDEALRVNLIASFRLTRALVGSMVQRGAGTIVHVSSDAAVEAYPRWGAYGASKAALDHLSRTWAAELDGTGVRVFAVDPGEMDTKMHADAMPDVDPATLARPEDVARRIARLIESPALAPNGARVLASKVQP